MRYSALLLAALMLTGVARASDGDADTCRMPGDTERRIAACTRLNGDKGLTAEMRALALSSRGLAREEKGDVKGAMADYDEAIRLDPRAANTRLFRSSLFRNAGNHDRAIDDLSEAIRIDPSVALFHTRRGLSYYAKHDYERAIADFTESLRLNPGNIDAVWGRGRANAYAGYKGRASPTIPKRSGSSRTRRAAMAPARKCTNPRATTTSPSPTSTNSCGSIRQAPAASMRAAIRIVKRAISIAPSPTTAKRSASTRVSPSPTTTAASRGG